MARQKDPNKRKFHEVTAQARRDNLSYNSEMDKYRMSYRVSRGAKSKMNQDDLFTNIMQQLKKVYKLNNKDLFKANTFTVKQQGKTLNVEILKYDDKDKKAREFTLRFDQKGGNRTTTWFAKRSFVPWYKSKLVFIEAMNKDETIQGFQAMIDKPLFRIETRRNWKAWKTLAKSPENKK